MHSKTSRVVSVFAAVLIFSLTAITGVNRALSATTDQSPKQTTFVRGFTGEPEGGFINPNRILLILKIS